MEQTQSLTDSRARPGAFGRLALKAGVLACLSAIIGLRAGDGEIALGAAGGALLAGFYAGAYLKTHLRDRERAFDRTTAASTMVRLVLVAIGGLVAWLAGKQVLIAYLTSFAVGFAILLASELPRVARDLRARGLIGGGKTS